MRPEGLTYSRDFITADEEKEIVANIEQLAFQEVRMHGVVARRTVVHFGYDYDYSGWKIFPTEPPPPWLEPLIDRSAAAAGIDRERLKQVLIARYPASAAIGWHRDAPMFGTPVIGVSLLSPCGMHFRLQKEKKTIDKFVQLLEPRSMYILDGPARSQWQHSIPRTKYLRYSISMRTLRQM
jgi:alkylated DNA repair protein (DNA oxidative demethylase)